MKHASNILRGTLAVLLILAFASIASAQTGPTQGTAQEIVPDGNTVILDHFNGTTDGTAVGGLAFGTSLNGLGQAGVFGPGNYVKYGFAGWSTCYFCSSGQGTVEMWIRPNSLAGGAALLNVNWNNVGSYPSAGHILHLGIDPAPGNFVHGGFWPAGSAMGNTAISAGLWTHIALSWGPDNTKVYVNGLPVVGTPGGPALISTNYAYLNYWGMPGTLDGLIDEFHLSNIQRSDAEIAQHATIEIDIDIKPGSYPNSINPKSKGKIPVAILTTDTFDATTVDPTTVRFGATGTEAEPVQSAPEDVDGDGDTDMILHINTQDTGIECGDTSASLTGETFDGQAIVGSDTINTVGCK